MPYRPERDKPDAHLPFPPMPAAWREPTPEPVRPPPPRGHDLPPAPRTPLEYPSARTQPSPQPLVGPLPPQPATHPTSPIAYPGLPASAPPALAPYLTPYPGGQELSSRSSTVAGLLQMFLFPFAVGRFYTGHVRMALTQIIVAWGALVVGLCLGVFLFAPALIAWIGFLWPFIDGITLLTGRQDDADGRRLRP